MNTKLLRETVKYIEEEPRRFNMVTWYTDVIPGDEESFDYLNQTLSEATDGTKIGMEDVPPCGAVACLAGNVAIKAKLTVSSIDPDNPKVVHHYEPSGGWFEAARKALGITKVQAERLFYPSAEFVLGMPNEKKHWPEKFSEAYRAAKTPAARAKVLRKRVDHFIKTKGQE